jgi:predicted HTH domain antitoxin
MRPIEVPDEILDLLKDSALSGQSETDQVRSALAVHLFQEGLISTGKAAELSGISRNEFEVMLVRMGIPVVHYDLEDYKVDQRGIAEAKHPSSS